jgi:hypothetical protein
VIPKRADQVAHRTCRRSASGRSVSYDADAYKRRNVVERSLNVFRQRRAMAAWYDCEDDLASFSSGLVRATTDRVSGI